jgi:hypothetical protein
MKNAVFCDVTPRGSCKNRHCISSPFLLPLLINAGVVPSSPILLTLITHVIDSSELSVLK